MIEELKLKYPGLLDKCWEVSIGPGWRPMVEGLLTAMQQEQAASGVTFEVAQIKSKFGGLRFYYGLKSGSDPKARDRIWLLVRDAEHLSYKICEECGQHGNVRGGSWYVTLCDECDAKRPT